MPIDATSESNEERALAVAQADFDERVTWTAGYRVAVKTQRGRYVVSYLRLLAAREPMIRGAGSEPDIEYHIDREFAIERIVYPHERP